MSIPSPRLLLSLCALPMLSCRELNTEFCTAHPDDRARFSAGGGTGGGIETLACTSDAECASPTPVCDKARSMGADEIQ